jgi:hypothetical protein
MKKKHLYLKAADVYSIEVLARQIWKEEWDKEALPNPVRFATFDLKLIPKGLNVRTADKPVLVCVT